MTPNGPVKRCRLLLWLIPKGRLGKSENKDESTLFWVITSLSKVLNNTEVKKCLEIPLNHKCVELVASGGIVALLTN